MDDENLVAVAEKVSILLQLDRMRHRVGTEIDMAPLAALPAYIVSVFEEAGAAPQGATPQELYGALNRRMAEVQAQLYLMRLEMENRRERDPAAIYADPLVISAYGEQIQSRVVQPRSFDFSGTLMAYGWHNVEHDGTNWHRWMRPGGGSVVCLPHLGIPDQILDIRGYVLDPAQLPGLSVRSGAAEAEIVLDEESDIRFTARLKLDPLVVQASNYLPVEFSIDEWRTPEGGDTRMLGANISRFTLTPAADQDGAA